MNFEDNRTERDISYAQAIVEAAMQSSYAKLACPERLHAQVVKLFDFVRSEFGVGRQAVTVTVVVDTEKGDEEDQDQTVGRIAEIMKSAVVGAINACNSLQKSRGLSYNLVDLYAEPGAPEE